MTARCLLSWRRCSQWSLVSNRACHNTCEILIQGANEAPLGQMADPAHICTMEGSEPCNMRRCPRRLGRQGFGLVKASRNQRKTMLHKLLLAKGCFTNVSLQHVLVATLLCMARNWISQHCVARTKGSGSTRCPSKVASTALKHVLPEAPPLPRCRPPGRSKNKERKRMLQTKKVWFQQRRSHAKAMT